MPTKILIIKLGYSETLHSEIGKVTSLGDVLRTTAILWALKEKYRDSHITWLVTENAEPLLQGNHLIDRILTWDDFVPFQLMREKFDVMINLEKIAGVCALADMIDAWVKYGFRFDSVAGTYQGYEQGLDFISYIEQKHTDKKRGCWEKVMVEMLGVKWQEQPYIVGYKPQSQETFDIGFNYEVGSKWPYKALPMDTWKVLEKRLVASGYSVSWQKGNKNLYEYMDWINSCRMLVTNDSLGLHLAFAFRKKVVALFGPTDPAEMFFYSGCKAIRAPIECAQMPCGAPLCASGKYCMQTIEVETIETAVAEIMTAEGLVPACTTPEKGKGLPLDLTGRGRKGTRAGSTLALCPSQQTAKREANQKA